MKKNIYAIYSLIIFFLINGCAGYEPIFSSGNLNFKISKYTIEGDKRLGNEIYSRLFKSLNFLVWGDV